MNNYKILNNATGWFVWLIATITYVLTIEPTTSFWDCGEFIATAYKLEVGHPPGAPFFMILARFFSLFAFGDVTQVAKMVNILAALSSSFTILFLFWSITHIAKKLVSKGKELDLGDKIAVLGSGVVGALAYTWSDSFWFSAVEGELYATSSFFTAIVVWAIFKWENVADEKYANRWIILIAYLMGLSIGVHLLNLLAIPFIVFAYYFKKYKVTRNGIIITSAISVGLLLGVMYGIIQGLVKVAASFELLFVNSFGMPYDSGLFFFIIALTAGLIYGLYYTFKNQKPVLNTILLAFAVILIGYSSFAMIVVRSLADPPMDENNPDNVFSLQSYLNREQYGDRPLGYGQYYNASIVDSKEGKKYYAKKGDKYVVSDRKPEYIYDEKMQTAFPRMYSPKANHVSAYKEWANIKGRSVRTLNSKGEMETLKKPTFAENLTFFFKYQIGHMYLRYFLWNFAGRQNDVQGHGGIIKGNWISGIDAIDSIKLGPQDNLPGFLENNKARNKYYFLPLILGLIGLLFQANRSGQSFILVGLLFFFTGIAIVIYLNQYPYQPRERDYAFAASFYAFAMWIGLGVLALYDALRDKAPRVIAAGGVTVITLVLVPGIMASENWDDHDRSHRYTARDFARNYLESCAPNAILFTNGDNDTFPLWYAQEVEGIRTDVRVVNLSLLNTDWYIDQMKRKAYDSDPVPFSLTKDKYIQGTRDVVYLVEHPSFKDKVVDIDEAMEFVASDDPRTRLSQHQEYNFIPSKKLRIKVPKEKLLANGTVRPEDADKILDHIDWTISKSYVMKSELMIIDLLATNNWERPVYFAITVGRDSYLNLESFFQLEGLAYRVVPIKTKPLQGQLGRIDSEAMYTNIMDKFTWGGINDPRVYLDENNMRMTMNLRNNFARLADQLLLEGKRDSAVAVLDKCLEIMPNETVQYNYFIAGIIESYYKAGEIEKANEIAEVLCLLAQENLNYFYSLEGDLADQVSFEIRREMAVFNELVRLTKMYRQKDLYERFETKFGEYYQLYQPQ